MTDQSTSPQTVVQVITSGGWGGREQLPLTIHRQWLQQGRDVRLVVGEKTELARQCGREAMVDTLPTGRLSFALALRRRIRLWKPGVIICHFTHDLPSVRAALAGEPDLRLLVIKHLSPGPPKRDFVHRFLYRRVDRLLAVSEHLRRKCIAAYPIDAGRVAVWHPGVDVERFLPDQETRARIRGAAGVTGDDYLIGYAARITPRKGFEELLEMMMRLHPQVPQARLWLIGGISPSEKAYEQELNTLVHELGLDHIVGFIGHQDRVEDYLCALDLFVTPSREESFGLTTVEAMALGLPVVGFRAAGTAEIMVDGQTGLLADPGGDAAAELTRLVLQMAQNRPNAAAMGIAARERAVAMFSSNAMIQRLDQQLQSLPLRAL